MYKVLLDLLSIKTIIGFAQRPLLWFGILALPCLIASAVALIFSVAPILLFDGTLVLPYVGTGILYGALAIFLLLGGAIAELVYATGDTDLSKFSRLLARRPVSSGDSDLNMTTDMDFDHGRR